MKTDFKRDKFTLVLSGGGALGIAHLGVLHNMQELDLSPSEIVGTSMGGIIGACLAIGMSEDEIFEQIDKFSSMTKWIALSFTGNAIIKHTKIMKILSAIFGQKKMSDTKIPLKLIATNLQTGDKKVFSSHDNILIVEALLATMAIPGIFEECHIDDEIYGDGFLCENLGITEASFDNVLAVDVLGANSFDRDMPDNFFKTGNVMEMFEKSMRLLIYNQTKTNIAYSNKNILLIEPSTKGHKTFHFHKTKELRDLGLGLL